MAMRELLLPEFDQEMATTRPLLERVPAGDPAWRPHPKSMPLGVLAIHVARLPGWAATALTTSGLDLAVSPASPAFTDVAALLELFDRNVAAGRAALVQTGDADYALPWSLSSGAQTYFTLPRGAVLRSMALNHLIHHRAQLGVYLRLLNVPLPPCYGPTADMNM